ASSTGTSPATEPNAPSRSSDDQLVPRRATFSTRHNLSRGGGGVTAKLEIDRVRKSYGDKVVLDDMTLSVDEHEVVCLIGPSGCGKSTLLRCVDLLDPIDSGAVRLDGQDITTKGTDTNA